jgi:GAF domain-containing protein
MAQRFAEMARRLANLPTQAATWQAVVRAGMETVAGAQAAGITTLRGKEFESIAPTSELVTAVDAIQYELRSGPCVDAVLQNKVFRSHDLEHDQRWPEFGKRAAAEQGVHSMLAFRLYLEDDNTIGALNLYSTEQHAFSDEDLIAGEIVATHAAIVLTGSRRRDDVVNLQQGLQSNREVGVALGILMSRHRITREQAFDLLRLASQHSHRKLHELALEVGETGMLDYPAGIGG